MQSWATQSPFAHRDTGREPSKSGVIGLLCAALGKPRQEQKDDGHPTLHELSALRFGVRTDRDGTVMVDYQTIGGSHGAQRSYAVGRADGSKGGAVESWRYYLADAEFLVGLESSDDDLLGRIDAATQDPHWPLFLGRKSCPPSMPIWLPDEPGWPAAKSGVRLEEALESYPWLGFRYPQHGRKPAELRITIDSSPEESSAARFDVPVSFELSSRRYLPRYVHVYAVPTPLMNGSS